MTNTEEKVDAFFPLVAVKELALLRLDREIWNVKVADLQDALYATDEYKTLAGAESNLQIAAYKVSKAEATFRAGCEDIFIETAEKIYPGGKIKMKTTYEYIEMEAIRWAVKRELLDLLKLDKPKFKKTVSGTLPSFVLRGKVGKFYLEKDLSQYLESSDEEKQAS